MTGEAPLTDVNCNSVRHFFCDREIAAAGLPYLSNIGQWV
jgi:hypothetical protein